MNFVPLLSTGAAYVFVINGKMKKGGVMFKVIKANITPQEAEELYPDNHIVLLFPKQGDDGARGDVIYVGDVNGAYSFTEPVEPPEGHAFYMLRGVNLREMAPIEAVRHAV
jgi:hypothetical protein